MNIEDYKTKIKEIGFMEYPNIISGREQSLGDFVDYKSSSLDLRIHLAKVIICRCFPMNGGISLSASVDWFLRNFFSDYANDFFKPEISGAIKEAVEMILSEDSFKKGIIGTTFMFGVIEFYAKYKLGFRPNEYDFFDSKNLDPFRKMFLNEAIHKLKKLNTALSKSINEIDKHNTNRLKEIGIPEERWVKSKIADRLSFARNPMVHGEAHHFYYTGEYLAMLYILFYLHDQKEIGAYG